MTKSIKNKIFLISFILGSWLTSTLLLDFLIVPKIFRTLSDRSLAGEFGIYYFTNYNLLELFFAITLFCCLFLMCRKGPFWSKVIIFLSGLNLMIISSYVIKITPMIRDLSIQMKENFDVNSMIYSEIEKKHSFIHHLYEGLDGVKILILIIITIIFMKKIVKDNLI